MTNKDFKNASIYYLIGSVFNKGIAFLTVPIFTRILSTSAYGIVTTYNSWVGILAMIMGFALHMSIRMAAVDYRDKFDDFFSSAIMFVTYISAGMIATAVLVVKIFHINTNISLIIICMVQAYATATIEDYSNYLMMQYRYKFRTALMILPNLIAVVLSVFSILFVFKSELYMGRILPTAAVTFAFGIVVFFVALRKGGFKINKNYIKYALAISSPLILHGIALNILSQSDRIMITALADTVQTGIYSLVYNFSMIATVITTTLEGVWVPWFIRKLERGERKSIQVLSKDYIHLMTYAMGILILVAPEIVKLLANENYWTGISIIPPIVLSNYVIFAYSLYVNIEHYYKKTFYITFNTLIAAISNLVLNYIFIPKYGYVAAACTTLVSYTISFILHSRYAGKLEPSLYPISQFAIPLVHLIIITVIFYIFKENTAERWGLMLIYFVAMTYKERKKIALYFPELNNTILKIKK